MAQLRIALAQVNATVGDLAGNASLIVDWTRAATDAGAHVVVFPEMALTGYPVEDLALRPSFAAASRRTLDELAGRLADSGSGMAAVYVGHLDRDKSGSHDAAAVLYGGEVVATQFKHHLPSYGVFDEARCFRPGQTLDILRIHGVDVGMAICEDIWQDGGPISALGEAGVDLVVVSNASPFERDKGDVRLPVVARRAREARAPLAYVNLVGGQDELVFDGNSMIVDVGGGVIVRAPQFVEHLLVADLDLPGGGARTGGHVGAFAVRRRVLTEMPLPIYPLEYPLHLAEPLPRAAEVWSALVTSLRDFVRKNGFRSVVLGLSGGIDSAVVATLAVDALGPDAVHGVSMPSAYSSAHSRSDAAELATRTKLHYQVQPITGMVELYVNQLGLTGLAEENVQARCRGVTLMALSNQHGHLVLATGNKSELAVGYSTIYGDAVGGFAPLKDVPKTLVWELAIWRNAEADRNGQTPPIPESSIVKAPSAELRPGQLDSDSLPDYSLLDDIVDHYVEGDRGYRDLLDNGYDAALVERVLQMVDEAEYKRRQYPPGTKISGKAFGRDRRLPITNQWREGGPYLLSIASKFSSSSALTEKTRR